MWRSSTTTTVVVGFYDAKRTCRYIWLFGLEFIHYKEILVVESVYVCTSVARRYMHAWFAYSHMIHLR